MPQFLSEKIKVSIDKAKRAPVLFIWNKKEYKINEIIAAWHDWGFSEGAPKARTWRLRHHRNYYRVQTTDDEVFEIYLDRKSKKADKGFTAATPGFAPRREEGEWFLYQKIK